MKESISMRAGLLDTEVKILRPEITRNAFGEQEEEYKELSSFRHIYRMKVFRLRILAIWNAEHGQNRYSADEVCTVTISLFLHYYKTSWHQTDTSNVLYSIQKFRKNQ